MDATAWTDLDGTSAVLVVPVGATEQHGPHLPLTTDTDIAVGLCERIADHRDVSRFDVAARRQIETRPAVRGVVVAPPLAFGSSGEHAAFPGTLSIGAEVTTSVLVELGRSACRTFARVLFVNTHGGNLEALDAAVALLRSEGRDVRAFVPRWSHDAHAGFAETSLMLALRPDAVRLVDAEAGCVEPLESILDDLRAYGIRSVAPNGVLGDPAGASAQAGRELLDRAVLEARALLREWATAGVAG